MWRIIKPLRDFFLIFYDDLEFKAMSLPRIGAGVLTAVVIVAWYADQFKGRRFEHFGALATLCGGVWGGYAFKKWTGRGESVTRSADDEEEEEAEPDEKLYKKIRLAAAVRGHLNSRDLS